MERLRRLGADELVIDEVNRRWAGLTDAEKIDAYRDVNNLTDDELRQQIAETQAEAVEAVPDGSVQEVLEWVGGDRGRATAALLAERAKLDDDRRKTLVEPLVAITNG